MPNVTEIKAMDFVINYEKEQGRNPKDVSKTGCGYDIRSDERCIEVKGQSSKQPDFIGLYKKTLKNLGKDVLNYYIYLVYDIKEHPKLKIIPPDVIFGNLEIDPQFLLPSKAIRGIKDIAL
jgi:hypothetical protein